MMIERNWYQRSLLTFFLIPFSWLYRLIIFFRRLFYRVGLFKSARFSVPVIVVGNITTGGTGKTPLVAWLATYLKNQGYRPGIVSRGFRACAKSWPQVVTADSNPVLVGDEPFLLAQKTQCPVVVDPDRVAAVKKLLADFDCDVVISDDGLQHYALERDIEIAVVDGVRHFGNQHCLPAGPLREPLHRLNQVDFIVCNGASESNWYAMELLPDAVLNVADPSQEMTIEACRAIEWQALAGIGNPARFFLQLESLGLTIHSHVFPDHYAFSKQDILFGQHDFVMMTEKDAVKCRSFADKRHWYLPVTARLESSFENDLLERFNHSNKAKNPVLYS